MDEWTLTLWFLSTVVVGILINLASDYAKPYIDSHLEKWFDSRRIKNEIERERVKRIADRMNNPQHYIYRSNQLLIALISISTVIIMFFSFMLSRMSDTAMSAINAVTSYLMGKPITGNLTNNVIIVFIFAFWLFSLLMLISRNFKRISFEQRVINKYLEEYSKKAGQADVELKNEEEKNTLTIPKT